MFLYFGYPPIDTSMAFYILLLANTNSGCFFSQTIVSGKKQVNVPICKYIPGQERIGNLFHL